ncbi:hypothetical protein QN085_15910 [Pseudomonas sp. M2(2023)]|uniref:hypothetical protein n=1 Tax=Pseudomonas sp. M2(2023) TaxID=3049084 RepID=UPI002552904F|nr:hypothetical protein [Pseudomonas sp. M2(2023)]WIV26575.1 hypothetical protein QN085_15910 [Pseudomonas sp. M2(2023)]
MVQLKRSHIRDCRGPHAKVSQGAPRYQASGNGTTWDVVEIATGAKHGFAYSYRAALRFVDAMEAGAASKQGGMQ